MGLIKRKHILRQLHDDLIGKDSYRGVTLTYSWMANQFGHFALGFIPSLIVFVILRKHTSWSRPALDAAILVSVSWFLFELYNFLGPLLLNRKTTTKLMYLPGKNKYIFSPAWGNIAFDTLTDLLFFWMGAFSACLFLQYSEAVLILLGCLLLAVLYPAGYWFLTKMYLQYARFPVQFRLSQWKRLKDNSLPDNDRNTVLTFIKTCKTSSGNHLLLFGGRGSGKSALSIGIGTELSIKRCPASYYTGMKWFSLLSFNDAQTRDTESCEVWTWRNSSVLIVDDINPGNPVPDVFLSPAQVLSMIHTPVDGDPDKNKKDLRNKNVIWVVGDEAMDSAADWMKMLTTIGIREDGVKLINLGYV